MAHCLELDVLTWGTSVEHAVEMVREAAGTVLAGDLSKDRDPLLRRAPQEDWDAMWTRLRGARPQPLSEVANAQPEFVILESVVTVTGLTPTEFASLVAGAQRPEERDELLSRILAPGFQVKAVVRTRGGYTVELRERANPRIELEAGAVPRETELDAYREALARVHVELAVRALRSLPDS